jgi:iron complex outermembrane receptor protein
MYQKFLPGVLLLLASVLVSAQELEEVTVLSTRDSTGIFAALKMHESVDPGSMPGVSTTADLIETIPGISLNGQGGSLQAYSLRGLSRARIQTRVNNVLINTERRAGNSASFIDPFLIQRIDIVKGPASVLYGSGAIGGVVSLEARRFNGTEATASVFSNGLQSMAGFGAGSDHLSFAVAHRHHRNGQDASGETLNDGFERGSFTLSGQWQTEGDLEVDVSVAGGSGRNIGKSSADFPDQRITRYPSDDHLLGSFQVMGEDWLARYTFHDYQLDTVVDGADRIEESRSGGFDEGLELQKLWRRQSAVYRLGLEYAGRRDVQSEEAIRSIDGVTGAEVLDARQHDLSLFSDGQWHWQDTSLHIGFRHSRIRQSAEPGSDRDSSWTGSVEVSHRFNSFIEGFAQVSTGFRFPQLTEKFFSGVTPRGETLGNPLLEAERSLGGELGIHLEGERFESGVSIHYTEMKDYIERVAISDRLRGYRNVEDGRIYGVEFWITRQLSESWSITGGGHWLNGEDGTGEELQDMVPAEIQFGFQRQGEKVQLNIDYQHRFETGRVHASELPLDAYNRVSAALRWTISSRISARFWVRNLLQDTYRVASDDLSPLSSGTGAGISFSWYN